MPSASVHGRPISTHSQCLHKELPLHKHLRLQYHVVPGHIYLHSDWAPQSPHQAKSILIRRAASIRALAKSLHPILQVDFDITVPIGQEIRRHGEAAEYVQASAAGCAEAACLANSFLQCS